MILKFEEFINEYNDSNIDELYEINEDLKSFIKKVCVTSTIALSLLGGTMKAETVRNEREMKDNIEQVVSTDREVHADSKDEQLARNKAMALAKADIEKNGGKIKDVKKLYNPSTGIYRIVIVIGD